MDNLVINGVSLLALVFGLVEFAKKLGWAGSRLTWLSAGLGLAAGLLFELLKLYPDLGSWVGVLVGGLAVGLAAAGMYDFVDQRFPKDGGVG